MKAVFKTSDGEEFSSEKMAKAHEQKIEALKKYEAARKFLLHSLAGCMTTADDELFEAADYFYIGESFGMPSLHRISMLGYYWQEFELHTDGTIGLLERYEGQTRQRTLYRIGDLYRSETKAKAALVKAMDERIAAYQRERQSVAEKFKP